jgi:hypothetical protein
MTRNEKIRLIRALQTGSRSLDDIFYSPIIIKYPDGTYSSNGRKITEARIDTLSFPETIILLDNGREDYPDQNAQKPTKIKDS